VQGRSGDARTGARARCAAFSQDRHENSPAVLQNVPARLTTNKYLLLAYAALTLVLGVIQPATASALNTPEAAVRAFYAWYLEREGGPYQLMDNAIYRYVAKPTVDNPRDDYKHKRLPGGSDYFTRVQDLDEKEWLNSMALHPTVVLDGVVVIAVTFGAKEKKNIPA
jgi:hypothetical protein